MYVCVPHVYECPWCPERATDLLKMELQVLISWVQKKKKPGDLEEQKGS